MLICAAVPAQLLYCLVWGLVYVDQGLLSSNGVTGTRSTDPSNSAVGADTQGGLQVRQHMYVILSERQPRQNRTQSCPDGRLKIDCLGCVMASCNV